jgi:predicted membrane protein
MEHNHTRKRLLIGLFILLAGLAILLNNLGFLNFEIRRYILRWELLLVVVGLVALSSHGNKAPGLIMILIGGTLYMRDFMNLQFHFWQVFWPGILILAGIMMIFRRKFEVGHNGKKNVNDEDVIDEVAVFGGGDRIVLSQNFQGGKVLAVFGGSNFNMARAKMAPGKNYIDLLAIFGGVKLIVPEDWHIRIDVVSIFGGFSDKHRIQPYSSDYKPTSELVIKGFVLFGGGEIRSF